jgi:hypothetical protein
MTFQLEADTASRLTNWANGGADAAMEAPSVNASLSSLLVGFDAPLPPPQRIDFSSIEQQARADMDVRLADLPQGRSYWTEGLASPTAPLNNPAPVAAAEPAVYYGGVEPAPVVAAEPAISMASLNRAATYANNVGGAFNKGAAQPVLPHMASRFSQTNKPQI